MSGAGTLGHSPDSTRARGRFARLRVRVGGLEHRPDPLQQLGRDVVAAALGTEHLLQLPLEVGMACARVAASEVPLDLHAVEPDQLTVEVELDLSQDMLAISR